MKSTHWQTWICRFRCSETFGALKDLHEHVMEAHGEEFLLENLGLSANMIGTLDRMSRHSDSNFVEAPCVICSAVSISTEEQYRTHMGNHLEAISLLALTHADDKGREAESIREQGLMEVAQRASRQSYKKQDNPSDPNPGERSSSPEREGKASRRATTIRTDRRLRPMSWRGRVLDELTASQSQPSEKSSKMYEPPPTNEPLAGAGPGGTPPSTTRLERPAQSDSSQHALPPDSNLSPDSWTETLAEVIYTQQETNIDERDFLPANIIESLQNQARIKAELNTCQPLSTLVDSLTEYILNRPAIKIFLTLVACELTADIIHFDNMGLSDHDLPIDRDQIAAKKNAIRTLGSGREITPGQPLPPAWGPKARGDFATKQWLFLAPVFTRDNFRRVLDKRCPLPFFDMSHSTKPVTGFSGLVREIRVHEAHQRVVPKVRPSYVINFSTPSLHSVPELSS